MARGRGAERTSRAQRARMVERQLRRRGIERRARAASDGGGPEGAVRARGGALARLRRLRAADRARARRSPSPGWWPRSARRWSSTGAERVLEIGTGSGYSAAVLARLAPDGGERRADPGAGRAARARALAEHGRRQRRGGRRRRQPGACPGAPFDAIAVHAATPEAPHSLLAQLAPGGRLVVPIAAGSSDLLTAFRRDADGALRQETIGPCRFVPLIGAEGFEQAVSSLGSRHERRPLRPQLLLGDLRRPAQARPQDRDDPARRQVAQVQARPGRLGHGRLPPPAHGRRSSRR